MTAPRPRLRLGPRRRLARWLRKLAGRLDDQRRSAPAPLRSVPDDPHGGPGPAHACRCDSHLLHPRERGRTHPCTCQDGPEEPSHLPPGGPPFIRTASGGTAIRPLSFDPTPSEAGK